TGLERLQRTARARRRVKSTREVIAGIVGEPHRILVCACDLPSHFVPVRRLLGGNRHPMAAKLVKLTGLDRSPLVAQLNSRPAGRMKKVVAPILDQSGRSRALDHRWGRHWNADHVPYTTLLLSTGLKRLQPAARARRRVKSTRE